MIWDLSAPRTSAPWLPTSATRTSPPASVSAASEGTGLPSTRGILGATRFGRGCPAAWTAYSTIWSASAWAEGSAGDTSTTASRAVGRWRYNLRDGAFPRMPDPTPERSSRSVELQVIFGADRPAAADGR